MLWRGVSGSVYFEIFCLWLNRPFFNKTGTTSTFLRILLSMCVRVLFSLGLFLSFRWCMKSNYTIAWQNCGEMCALKYVQLLKRYIQIELYSRIWQFLVAYHCNDGFELVPMLQLNWISHDSMNNFPEIQLRFCTVERARKTEKHFWDILWNNFYIALSFLMNLSSILGIFQK